MCVCLSAVVVVLCVSVLLRLPVKIEDNRSANWQILWYAHKHTQRQTNLAHLHSRCIGTPTQQGHAHTGRTCHTVDSWIKAIKMRKSCYFIFIIRKQKQKRSCLRIMPSWSMYYICVSVRQCVCEWAWLLLRLLCILLGALKVCFSNWIMHLMAQAKGRDRAPERERVEERESKTKANEATRLGAKVGG